MFWDIEEATCRLCGTQNVSAALGVCLSCIREKPDKAVEIALKGHERIRKEFNLPVEPPKDKDGIQCTVCANNCKIGEGNTGYCGIRKNIGGKIIVDNLIHTYYDPIPTNCCASWFCGAKEGYNLAVFPYGCSLDCVFCQNWEHKRLDFGNRKNMEELIIEAERASCICYFGGTPEPQLPFLIKATKKILENKNIRVCWEWNGTGNPSLVRQCAEISYETNGTIKFDLKAFDKNLNIALTGRPNDRTIDNFKMIAEEFKKDDMLTATTLLIPGYIDEKEIESIAKFISSLDPNIPYSLLAFHPDFKMLDIPPTSRKLAYNCYHIAKRYLKRVHIGNAHLLL